MAERSLSIYLPRKDLRAPNATSNKNDAVHTCSISYREDVAFDIAGLTLPFAFPFWKPLLKALGSIGTGAGLALPSNSVTKFWRVTFSWAELEKV